MIETRYVKTQVTKEFFIFKSIFRVTLAKLNKKFNILYTIMTLKHRISEHLLENGLQCLKVQLQPVKMYVQHLEICHK